MNNNNYVKESSNDDNILDEKIKKTNIIAMASTSFFMNFASGMIVSSANNFLSDKLNCSQEFLGIVRGGAEGMGNLFKIIFGMLSDYMGNRKIFLLIGYGGMFLIKPMFGFAALDFFSKNTRIFIYGFNHAVDRILNAMRDGVRDASIYESSSKKNIGHSLGLRKLMACLGSTFGGLFSFWIIRKYGNLESLYYKMYFSTVIPVIISMFILIFFVKDLFKEKHKDKPKEVINFVSPNELPGAQTFYNFTSVVMGFITVFGGLGLLNQLNFWNIQIINNLDLLKNIGKLSSIGIIFLLVVEIFLVKIYPKFFHKDSNNTELFNWINYFGMFFMGSILGQILLLMVNTHSFKHSLYLCFFHYGLNISVIIPFILFFKWIFYKLYLTMQDTLEFYSPQLKKYDKIIILNLILAFSKYSDIFLFKHIIDCCHWDSTYSPLLFALLYFIFGVFSFILGKLSDGFFKKYSLTMLVTVNILFNLLAGYLNILPMNYFFGIVCLCLYGIYVGFIDCVLVSIVSQFIPSNHLLATLLGLFYLLIGVGNTCASYLFGTVFKTPLIAYRYAIIPASIGFLYYFYYKNELTLTK
jgi:MFS family permease